MAFRHPYVVYGQQGTLASLHQLGFVSYDNLFDESYDTIPDLAARRRAIVDLVRNLDCRAYDAETQARIEHNHQLFFNRELVAQRVTQEIINPLLEYAHS
jgi:hypothetical protein